MMPVVLVARMGFMLGQRYLRPVHVASAYGVKALGSCPAWKSFLVSTLNTMGLLPCPAQEAPSVATVTPGPALKT